MTPTPKPSLEIEVENLGGLLGKTKAAFKKNAINIIEAPNASGKTSLVNGFALSVLPAHEAGMHQQILHSHEKTGHVTLKFDNTEIHRTITRERGKVEVSGASVDNHGLVRLFAVADENNPLLKSVLAGQGDLDAILTKYSGIDALKEKLEHVKRDIERNEESLVSSEDKRLRLDKLRKEIEKTETSLSGFEEKRKKLKERLGTAGADKSKSKLRELGEVVANADRNFKKLSDEVTALESIMKSQSDRLKASRASIEKLSVPSDSGVGEKEKELEKLDNEKEQIDKLREGYSWELTQLRNVVSLIDKGAIQTQAEGVERLMGGLFGDKEKISCPICGAHTTKNSLSSRMEKFETLFKDTAAKLFEIEEKRKSLSSEIAGMRRAVSDVSRLRNDVEELEYSIGKNEKIITERRGKRASAEKELQKLSKDYDAMAQKETSDTGKVEKELIEMERKCAVLEESAMSMTKESEALSTQLKDTARLKASVEALNGKAALLSSEIERHETGLIKRFNEEIGRVYKNMKFSNVDRIWLDNKFKLVVVRKADGKGYEDKGGLATLSRTEREIVGLVLVLSGYQVHGLSGVYPIFIVDEVSSMDTQRLNLFIVYAKSAAPTVVLATIPGREIEAKDVNVVKL